MVWQRRSLGGLVLAFQVGISNNILCVRLTIKAIRALWPAWIGRNCVLPVPNSHHSMRLSRAISPRRFPFQKSVNVTFKAGPGQPDDVIYIIVRGAENLPINIGGILLPTTARMNLQKINKTIAPLDFVNVVDQVRGWRG